MKSATAAPLPALPVAAMPMPMPGAPWLRAVPMLLSLAVLACVALPRVRATAGLFWAIVGVGGGLVVWQVVLWLRASRGGRALAIEVFPPVRQHFVQACVQCCLYAYWGYLWEVNGTRPIYAQLPLILAQFAFLYAFDALFSWTRGRAWRLGSGPVPIVLSTNLFIWFRDPWFVWQFAMIAAGLLGKEFVKWQREGRRTHIFNPSGFGLACAATVLIATGSVDITWAKELATTLEVPGIFLFLFGLGLVVQWFFRVTLMTFAAAFVMVAINVVYTEVTGVYLFGSTNLPAAAFLGLHLLMTDPSTSPRTFAGRTLFGLGYGIGYIVVFEILGALGAPELFAKLYPVPILNCCVQVLDRWARTGWLSRLNTKWESALPAARMNLVHMAAWAAFFGVLLATRFLYAWQPLAHPGNSIAFWKRAVAEGRHDAERKLVMVAGSKAVAQQSPEALNELGILSLEGDVDAASAETRMKSAANWFAQAAARGSGEACENLVAMFLFLGARRSDEEVGRALHVVEQRAASGAPRAMLLLGLAHETEGARPLDPKRALELYRRCGDDVFAQKGIARIGLAPGSLVDLTPIAPVLAAAAAGGDGEAAFYLAYMHATGRGIARDEAAAKAMWARAVERGFPPAVEAKPAADGALPTWSPPRRRFLQRPPWSTAVPLAQ